MSSSAIGSNQRLKLLYLQKILTEKTDENHAITMPEIIKELEGYGISAARKALYEDIEALRAFGLDIVSVRGGNSCYYVASRDFSLPELKLLADAVCSAKFLTEKKSRELLKKLQGLASVYEGRQIQRQVFVADRVKAMNERIYQNVDAIHSAIEQKKEISFDLFDYTTRKTKKLREGKRVCSPYALTWDNGCYYLVGYYQKRDMLTNFRVDRMDNVAVLETPVKPLDKSFTLSEYLNSTFSMFSGEAFEVTLRFHNSLINSVIDRFGTTITMFPDGNEHFTVHAKVKANKTFFGWLFQFGSMARIVAPENVKNEYRLMLKEVSDDEK